MVRRREAIKIIIAGSSAVAALPLLAGAASADIPPSVAEPVRANTLPPHFTIELTVQCDECHKILGLMRFDELDDSFTNLVCHACYQHVVDERDELENDKNYDDDDDESKLEELEDDTRELMKELQFATRRLDTMAFDVPSDKMRDQIREMLRDLDRAMTPIEDFLR